MLALVLHYPCMMTLSVCHLVIVIFIAVTWQAAHCAPTCAYKTIVHHQPLVLCAAVCCAAGLFGVGAEEDPGPELLTGNVTWGDKALQLAQVCGAAAAALGKFGMPACACPAVVVLEQLQTACCSAAHCEQPHRASETEQPTEHLNSQHVALLACFAC
jgi:hypothetical protein